MSMMTVGAAPAQPRARHWQLASRLLLLVAVTFGVWIGYVGAIEPWHVNWGATSAEIRRAWPGDELVPNAGYVSTRAVTINAPPEAIWPWIVQMGQGRGGLYSYTFLENLVGSDLHNADQIHPEWQNLHVGDSIRPIPEVWFGIPNTPEWKVVTFEPNRVINFQGWAAFILEPVDQQSTRLIVRSRGESPVASMEPFNFIMGRRTMLGIKERAEGALRPAALDVIEVLLWTIAFMVSVVAAVWVVIRKAWIRPFAIMLTAIAVFLFLLFGRPPLPASILLNLSLVVAVFRSHQLMSSRAKEQLVW